MQSLIRNSPCTISDSTGDFLVLYPPFHSDVDEMPAGSGDRSGRLVVDEGVQLVRRRSADRVAVALAGSRGEHERAALHVGFEVSVRLAAVDDGVEVTAGVGDGLALDLEVRPSIGDQLGEGLLRVRRNTRGRGRAAGENLPGLERDATALELPLDEGAGAVRTDGGVIAGELLEVFCLSEGERTRSGQVNCRAEGTVSCDGDQLDVPETKRQCGIGECHDLTLSRISELLSGYQLPRGEIEGVEHHYSSNRAARASFALDFKVSAIIREDAMHGPAAPEFFWHVIPCASLIIPVLTIIELRLAGVIGSSGIDSDYLMVA